MTYTLQWLCWFYWYYCWSTLGVSTNQARQIPRRFPV